VLLLKAFIKQNANRFYDWRFFMPLAEYLLILPHQMTTDQFNDTKGRTAKLADYL